MTKKDNSLAPHDPPKPDLALARLNVFIGKWNTEGLIKGSPSGPTARLKAIDTYEWLPGGFFLIHHVDGFMGDEEVKTIEIIGYDTSSEMYFTHSYDNRGSIGKYQANLLDVVWTIAGKSERFTGMFSDDSNTLTGRWELSGEGDSWVPWMDIKLTKVV